MWMILFSQSAPLFFLMQHYSSPLPPISHQRHWWSLLLCGVKVVQSLDMLFLSQSKYVHDLLNKFNIHKRKPVRTPLPSGTMLSLIDGEPLSYPTEYRSMAWALQYLTMTRPDISYVVNLISQIIRAPHTTHLSMVRCIFDICRALLIMV